jgi:hypothetical protein
LSHRSALAFSSAASSSLICRNVFNGFSGVASRLSLVYRCYASCGFSESIKLSPGEASKGAAGPKGGVDACFFGRSS